MSASYGSHTDRRQLHTSYSVLGKDFKTIFEDLVKHITAQRSESDGLKRQLQSALSSVVLQNASMSARMQEALEEERRQSVDDRQKLLTQIAGLVNAQAEAQEVRFAERTAQIQKGMAESNTSLEGAASQYGQGMETWDEKEGQLLDNVKKSRDQLKIKLKDDWTAADDHSTSIQNTAKSVHAETMRVVDEQVDDLDAQMESLDDFVTRARSENANHHETHAQSVQSLSNTVEQSFGNISAHFKATFDRVTNLGEEMELDANDLEDGLEPLDTQLCQPLANLREGISGTTLQEYHPTGETPQKMQYHYPTELPRTKSHDLIPKIEEVSPAAEAQDSLDRDNTIVFADLTQPRISSPSRPSSASITDKNMSLREVNPNLTANLTANFAANHTTGNFGFDSRASTISMPADNTLPMFKHAARATRGTKRQGGVLVEGRENLPLTATVFSQSISRRKSPRLN